MFYNAKTYAYTVLQIRETFKFRFFTQIKQNTSEFPGSTQKIKEKQLCNIYCL